MRTLIRRAAPKIWSALMTPAAPRGSLRAEIGTLITAVVMGLMYWFFHSHR